MRTKKYEYVVSKQLSDMQVEKLLLKIGQQIKSLREGRTTIARFCYEVDVSRSALSKYEAGGEMLLSTFLKILYGLDTDSEEFFKAISKREKAKINKRPSENGRVPNHRNAQ